MGLFYRMLVLMLLLVLSIKVTLLEQRIEDAYDKAEDAAIIAALLYAEPMKPEPHKHKRFKPVPLEDCPWILQELVPEFIPPPETF